MNLAHLAGRAELEACADTTLETTPAPFTLPSTLYWTCLLDLWHTRSRQPLAALYVETHAKLANDSYLFHLRRNRTHTIFIVPHGHMVISGETLWTIENASEM